MFCLLALPVTVLILNSLKFLSQAPTKLLWSVDLAGHHVLTKLLWSLSLVNRTRGKNTTKSSVCCCSEFWPLQSWSSFPYGHWQRQLSLWATGCCELQPESCLNSDQRLKVPTVLCFYQKMSVLLVSTRREGLSGEITSTNWRPAISHAATRTQF